MPTLSVIVPVYNCADKVARMIASLKEQSNEDIEVIIVNDGSTDESEAVCRQCIAGDPRFTVISQRNSGVSAARNAGLSVAKGEYVSFVDADDWVEKDIYTTLVQRLVEDGAQLAVCGMRSHRSGRSSGSSSPLGNCCHDVARPGDGRPNDLIQAMIDNTPAADGLGSASNKVYLARIIRENNLRFDCHINFAEDWLFNVSYLRFCTRVSFCEAPLYNYDCSAAGTLSKRYRKDAFDTSVYIRQRLAEWFPSSCSGVNYYRKVFIIEKHFLCQHLRLFGFKKFATTVKHIFRSPELQKAYATCPKLGNSLLCIGAKSGSLCIYLIASILIGGGKF